LHAVIRRDAGEAAELARREQAVGNDVIVRAVAAGQHSFNIGAGRVPEVDDAIAEIGSWLRSKLGLGVLQGAAK
jgi:epsilon-lactone hydrolase